MSVRGSQHQGSEPSYGDAGLTVAAHELKSPLVLLRQLSIELNSDLIDDTDRSRIAQQMTLITEKALRLTSDLTRAQSQASLFELEPVNPLDVARDVRSELAGLYSAHQRQLNVKRIRHLPPVIANRDLLRRILLNFADNALHYSDVDGAVELQAQLINESSMIRLSVRDYGPHLPLRNWRALTGTLNEGQQVHSRPQSSGLGLYISHQFATAMNGRIGAVRHRDGASFYVELPVSRQLSLV